MLGHSVETNLKHYSFAQKDYLNNVRTLIGSLDDVDEPEIMQEPLGNPRKVINFPQKESPETLISQCF